MSEEIVAERGVASMARARSLQSRLSSALGVVAVWRPRPWACWRGTTAEFWRIAAQPLAARAQSGAGRGDRQFAAAPGADSWIRGPWSWLRSPRRRSRPPVPPRATGHTADQPWCRRAQPAAGADAPHRRQCRTRPRSIAAWPDRPLRAPRAQCRQSAGRIRQMPCDHARTPDCAGLLTPTATPAARATQLPTQRLLLAKGAFIDCTLETAIDSSLPGMTTCITATDTFSVDGKVVLLERGSKLIGETRGQVQQGSCAAVCPVDARRARPPEWWCRWPLRVRTRWVAPVWTAR